MRTRNAETPKSVAAKKTPVKKSATKTPPKPSVAAADSTTPKPSTSVTPTAASVTGEKNPETATLAATPSSAPKPEIKVEDVSSSVNAAQITLETKPVLAQITPETKSVPAAKSMVKKTPRKVKTPVAKATPTKTPKSVEVVKVKTEASQDNKQMLIAKVVEPRKKQEPAIAMIGESLKKEEPIVAKVVESPKKGEPVAAKVGESPMEVIVSEEEEVKEKPLEEVEAIEETEEPKNEPVNMQEDTNENLESKEDQPEENENNAVEHMDDYGEEEGFEEPGDEECAEDDVSEQGEEAGGLEMEMSMSALAKERKIKKEQEIFIGGLDRDAVEEDVKKAFEKIGDVIEVRLHRNPLTNKNKGFAFVKFADKEQASRALAELKNPIVRGKRCGTAPSEDNDTLFVGNICNTWTKEAIKQKLKEYGVDSVENITLVPDAQHEGLSRGFAFVEFSCHAEAMLAYKRLQRPDVVFGHAERTAKVAFAEPLREPDPEVMAQVKSVFVDGLPPYWDEDRVNEHFKGFGEIERIVLARNMSTAKRKDFGFVDFITHEAAIACIEGVNNKELGDDKSKTKVKARLANPLPKTQAVKGGMRGGFRIGRPGSGSFSRFGRGFGRGGGPFNHGSIQRGKSFYPRGRGRTGRLGFVGDNHTGRPYSEFPGRRPFGGRGGGRWGSTSSRPDLDRPRHGAPDRGHGKHIQSNRQHFSTEEEDFSRSYGGRQFAEDPYLYESGHGMKRPFSAMMDRDPGYLESSRLRSRFDHPDLALPSRGTRYRDAFGAGSGLYSHDYYGSDYGGGSYSSLYGGDRSYGSGYYY